jgi:light-regulated signal transduction histidine kinase (bacteriophytochrome)
LILLAIEDITERRLVEDKLKQLAEELARSNVELEHFASLASHDLKSPILAIGTVLRLFQRRYTGKLDTEADQFISDARKSALRMEKLISDILAYSRAGSQGKTFGPTDCSEALDISLANLNEAVESSKAEIIRDPLPKVIADPIQMVQLFQNLIGNAIKSHGEERPRIHISAKQMEKEWVFSVRDNGIGIPREQTEKIFEIFQRTPSWRQIPGFRHRAGDLQKNCGAPWRPYLGGVRDREGLDIFLYHPGYEVKKCEIDDKLTNSRYSGK